MHSTSILRGSKILHRYSAVAIAAASIAALAACGSPSKAAGESSGGGSSAGPGGRGSGAPIKVGLVYSETGALADYGKDYYQGFQAGLDYATHGTDTVNGHKIEVVQRDDAGDPTKAVSAAKDLIGQGYKILAGSTASGVALQVAPLAAQNKVLFISGPAATDESHRPEQVHVPVGPGDLSGHRHRGVLHRRPDEQARDRARSGQCLRPGERRGGEGGARGQGREGGLGARPRRARPT